VGSINDLLLPLESWVWVRYHRGVLVDSPPIFHYALHLNLISGLVVIRESEDLLAKVGRHHCSAVTNICNIADVINNYYDDGAGSRTIDFSDINYLIFSKLQEEFFGLSETTSDSFYWVLWEVLFLYNLL